MAEQRRVETTGAVASDGGVSRGLKVGALASFLLAMGVLLRA